MKQYCPHCGKDINECVECGAPGDQPHAKHCTEGEWEAKRDGMVNKFLWDVIEGRHISGSGE